MIAKILVVEDSSTQAQALAALLEDNDYEVSVVPDGDVALERTKHERFDLVLSDVMMERVGGYELCRRLKADPARRAIPVVLLTSLTDPLDIVRGLECGADNYITKPYEPEHLLARLRNVLDRRSFRRSARSGFGIEITFLDSTFTITSEKEQILDLFLSSVEDVIKTNDALQASQRDLAAAHAQLARYAREVERRERLTSEKFQSLMQHAADGIFVLDLDGWILEANAHAGELLGQPFATLPGSRLDGFLPQEEGKRFRSSLEALRTRGHAEVGELSIEHPGRTVYCEMRASAAGSDGLVLAILRDVTERKLALEAVRESKDTLQTLIDASPLAIASLGPEGCVTIWNRSAERLFGWSAEEVLGKCLPNIPEDREEESRELVRKLLAGERLLGVETVRQTRSGERVEVSLWAAPLKDSQGRHRGTVALVADVTERKALEQQLRQAQKMEAVGGLAGGIAHDFNNILAAISGYVGELLLDENQSETSRQDLEEVMSAVKRATSLTRQLLAFSRKQVLEPRIVNVNETTRDLEKMLRRVIRKNIQLVLELAPGLDTVFVDPGQLEQVIVNLVVNARDAIAGSGRITIGTHHAHLAEDAVRRFTYPVRAGSYVALTVADTGKGIEPSVQQKVFEPFFTTKPQGEGTGLGLSTVYGIVKQSQGYVTLESEPGRGTTVTIYLPLAQAAADPAAEAEAGTSGG